MRDKLLTAKYCKINATYYKRIVPTDYDKEPYYDDGIPLKIGIMNSNTAKEILVPTMNSVGTRYTIHTFRNIEFGIGDKIVFNDMIFYVVDFNVSFFNTTQYRQIKQFFATVK
jgi:hypothetical protein